MSAIKKIKTDKNIILTDSARKSVERNNHKRKTGFREGERDTDRKGELVRQT